MKKSAMAAALCAVFLTAACGKSGPQVASEAERGPLVAKVNGAEIYQGQVSAVLSRFGDIPADKLKGASKQVLDKIVEENLLLQQAREKKLDQDPKVVQALNAAHNEILVKAYLDQLASTAVKPTDAEIQAFFDANPALFKERKVYNLRELSVAARPDFLPKLQDAAAKAKSLEEVGAWLKGEKVGFSASSAAKAAEQLPLELVPRFAGMKDGEIVIIPTQAGILVEQLLGSQAQPVDLATAKPAIERLLATRKRNEAATNEVKQQIQKAKIEYFGDYAQAKPQAAAPVEKK
ncbi:MAG: EpsD family peptidyl-prolyl cis-trans isomerase [Rhodocyclaceae bacterium]|nr:EpsD family peptidyl-prolyl cis-trans isomerase [Rhodocyclaceae bacterium]